MSNPASVPQKNQEENRALVYTISQDKTFVDCFPVQFGWQKCAPLHAFGPATRNHYLFHYILSGSGTLIAADSKNKDHTYRLRPGQGFLICPSQRTHYFADGANPWEYVWLEFDGLKARESLNAAGLSENAPIYISNVQEQQKLLRDELLFIAHHGEESSLQLLGHLYLFLDALQKSSARRTSLIGENLKDYYVREAITFIENNYFNDISIEDISKFCNLNRSYFGKLFREVTETTPQDFLIRYRITKACEYLELSRYQIGEISQMVGYPSQLHFSRAFKKVMGISPREWRQKNQRK